MTTSMSTKVMTTTTSMNMNTKAMTMITTTSMSTKAMITTTRSTATAISTTTIITTTRTGCSCDHDADEIFESWGVETPRKYSEEAITGALAGLDEGERYGIVLRAKGIVACTDGSWIHFDYVPGEQNIRRGPAGITGRLCVIGSELKEHDLDHLFCLGLTRRETRL